MGAITNHDSLIIDKLESVSLSDHTARALAKNDVATGGQDSGSEGGSLKTADRGGALAADLCLPEIFFFSPPLYLPSI